MTSKRFGSALCAIVCIRYPVQSLRAYIHYHTIWLSIALYTTNNGIWAKIGAWQTGDAHLTGTVNPTAARSFPSFTCGISRTAGPGRNPRYPQPHRKPGRGTPPLIPGIRSFESFGVRAPSSRGGKAAVAIQKQPRKPILPVDCFWPRFARRRNDAKRATLLAVGISELPSEGWVYGWLS